MSTKKTNRHSESVVFICVLLLVLLVGFVAAETMLNYFTTE
ncbi:MAG: hypothetical protein WCJ72_03330 [Chryseobacterium sp.]